MNFKRLETGTLLITGCGFVVSLLLSLTSAAVQLETRFHQQLIALSPLPGARQQAVESLPQGLQLALLFVLFTSLLLYLWISHKPSPGPGFIILSGFSLFMAQLLGEVIFNFWLPVIVTLAGYILTALALWLYTRIRTARTPRPEPSVPLQAIQQKIDQQQYDIAMLMIRQCRFSQDLAELAYELGMKLEQQESWILARYLYQWMTEYDPGMADFVARMNDKINPALSQYPEPSTPQDDQERFGHYDLVRREAAGATATVYEAIDRKTHQRVALKILNDNLDDSTGGRDIMTFLHEAMLVYKLDHPNIVKIHDADIVRETQDDRVKERGYIAMDFIEGFPLSERLRRKQYLSAAESLRVMQAVLEALVFAHTKGVVHGDIKPANIMYDKHRKSFIVTDFGAAGHNDTVIDGERKITGTPAYMSPEQLSGARMDGRSDLFSLAVTMYHLLSGEQPFSGGKLSELKKEILTREIDIDRLNVPLIIRQVLQKAMNKKPYQRFADARQMLQSVTYCEQKLKQESP